jgi:hypothetical protein
MLLRLLLLLLLLLLLPHLPLLRTEELSSFH